MEPHVPGAGNPMTIGHGIAIAGIWIGVGLCAIGGLGAGTPMVAMFAFFATIAVVCSMVLD